MKIGRGDYRYSNDAKDHFEDCYQEIYAVGLRKGCKISTTLTLAC